MLDFNFIKDNKDLVRQAIEYKHLDKEIDLDKLFLLHENYINLLRMVETKRSLRNTLSSDIAKVKDLDLRKKLIDESSVVKNELADMEIELNNIYAEKLAFLNKIPNVLSPDVPLGLSEVDNVVIEKVGEPTKFDFEPKDHVDLGKLTSTIDVVKSSVITGTRFSYIKGNLVLLQFGLINFVFDIVTDKKIIKEIAIKAKNKNYNTFVPMLPPVFVRTKVMDQMARLEPQDDRYIFDKDEIALIGSAEHTMGPYHMNEVLDFSNGPLRYIGYSTSFRREAGSYGKDTRGIFRVHQFDKLEMESFSSFEDGLSEQNLMLEIQKYILKKLDIPFQVVMICAGDMGNPDYRQIDIESFLPGQNKYRETHTSDYMTDYQSRRLNIKDKDGEYVHMNDATAVAFGRLLIAIMENYQNKDGSISVPKVLKKYVSFDQIDVTK